MSFFSLTKKGLKSGLALISQISPKKSDVEIFTKTKIKLKDGLVNIQAVNANAFFESKLKANNLDITINELEFLVSTDLLVSSINLLQDEEVGFEVNLDKETLQIQGAKARHTIRITTENIDNFITPEEKKENLEIIVTVNSQDFIDSVKATLVSVGQPKSVYDSKFLNICMTVDKSENQFLIVSTDRYRVTKNVIPAEFKEISSDLESNKNYLTLPKNLQYIISEASDIEKVSLHFNSDFLWLKLGENSLAVRYGGLEYPDYNKIIPQSFACSFVVVTQEISMALRQAYLTARANTVNKSINLNIKPKENKIVIESKTDKGESSQSEVSVSNYQGIDEDWSQSFNADYLLDYINLVNAEKIFWESNPGKPSVLSPEGQKSKQLYLVSGLR